MWEGVGDRTELQHIDPHSYGHQHFFPVLLGCSTGGLGAQPLWVLVFSTASYLQLVWSPTADFLSSPGLYNDLTPTLLPASVTIALIQLVHGQGYYILIFLDQTHLLFTPVHFLFWLLGWVGGQYATLLYRGVGEGATPFPGLLHFTLDPCLIRLSVKQGGLKYYFLSLWYDSTWDWTQVSWAIGEHSNHHSNVLSWAYTYIHGDIHKYKYPWFFSFG